MHEKGLQRQIGVGPLVSSQKQRALLVPVINRLPNAYRPLVNWSLCSSVVLHRISLVRVSGESFRRLVFDALGGARDACLLGKLFCRRPVLPRPALPSNVRPDPTRPWYVRVLNSTDEGSHGISFVRASEELFTTVVFDALGCTRDGCVLRKQTRRHPILPGLPRPAAPPCAARPDPPVVCPGFGFHKYLCIERIRKNHLTRKTVTKFIAANAKHHIKCFISIFVESETRIYHGRAWGGVRRDGGQGGNGYGTPTARFAQEIAVPCPHQTIIDNPPKRAPGRTNKRKLI